mmetsp:Transcript_876/g.2662  ORF Transcript_876/g.2662 Transcript_876/m.2662 type:complete len:162 (-) Transcript_876:98-583(-)
MSKLRTGPGEPTLFAQTVARDILRKAREMDRVVAGTKYSAKLGGREAVIWRELRTGGGSPVIIVTTSSTRAEFGDATTALDCFVTHAQEAVVRKNKYESDEQTVEAFIYAHGSDGSSIKVLTVAPLRLPPYQTDVDARASEDNFRAKMLRLLVAPPIIQKK